MAQPKLRRECGNSHILDFNSGQPAREGPRDTLILLYSAGEIPKAPVSDKSGNNLMLWYPLVMQHVASDGQNVTLLLG